MIIRTIQEFLALPQGHQTEILQALRTKERLDRYLLNLNNKEKVAPHWVPCKGCEGGSCKRCSAEHRGWVWYEEESRDSSDIHPSQIDKCLKYLVLCCSGYADQHEERVDPRLRRIFDLGHAWHRTIQTYGLKGAFGDAQYYHPEADIDPDATTFDGHPVLPVAAAYWIRGSADALIDYYQIYTPSLGEVYIKVIHEYKTINSGGYERLLRPKPEHKKQATIYSAVFDAPIVVYLYLNKDNCNIADFPVPFDYTIWNDIVAKVYRVQHYVTTEQAVPWEETSAVLAAGECSSCGLRGVCQPPLKRIA